MQTMMIDIKDDLSYSAIHLHLQPEIQNHDQETRQIILSMPFLFLIHCII